MNLIQVSVSKVKLEYLRNDWTRLSWFRIAVFITFKVPMKKKIYSSNIIL